jgi:hypothetical protein
MNKCLIVFLLFGFSFFAQENWKRIGKTQIYFSDFSSKRDNVSSGLKYEYFKKLNSIIVVERGLGKQFQRLFKNSPQLFNDIFKNAYGVFDFDSYDEGFESKEYVLNNYLDSKHIKNISFDRILFLLGKSEVRNSNEYIWIFSNGYPGQLGGCLLKIVFKKNKKKLDYLFVQKDHCVM